MLTDSFQVWGRLIFFFNLLSSQLQDNKTFLAMINHVLSVDGFYFSTTYDLTHTLQRLSNTSPEFQEMSLLERVSLIVRYFYLFGFFFKGHTYFFRKNIYWFFWILAVSGLCMELWKLTMFQIYVNSQFRTPVCMLHRQDWEPWCR